MGQRQGSSKPVWFQGQKQLGNQLFAPGGMLHSLFSGGPSAAFEANAARSAQALDRQLSGQGILGSPLGVKPAVNLQSNIATGREKYALDTLLSSVQPAGTSSRAGAAGIFTK